MEWPHRYHVKAEWRDLDGAGHVNHAVYLTYMESARMDAYFTMTGQRGVQGLDIILAKATVDYRSQSSLGDRLVVEVRPGRVGETSFAFLYTIRDEASGRVVVEGETVQVCFDYEKQAKKKVPDAVRAQLSST